MNVRINAKLIDDGEEFDIINVELAPFQQINERTISENCNEEDLEKILRLLKES